MMLASNIKYVVPSTIGEAEEFLKNLKKKLKLESEDSNSTIKWGKIQQLSEVIMLH